MSKLKPLTLDLAKNARYSLHYLSHNLDPEYKYYTCHKTFFDSDPPYHQHTLWDHCETPARFLYAIMFARQLVGENEVKNAVKKIKKNLYRRFDAGDGLNYRPHRRVFGKYPEFPPQDAIPVRHEADMWDNRSVLMAMLLSGVTEGDKVAMSHARAMVKAFRRVSARKGNKVYLTRAGIPPHYRPKKNEKPHEGEHMYGWITPFFMYYRFTGDREALKLASGLCNYTVHRAEVDEWGILKNKVNIHSILFCLAGILRVAKHTRNKEHIKWCRKMYESIKKHWGSSFGWIAEHPDDSKLDYPEATQSGETCTTVDYIDTAIRLAQAGYPEYWNDAERFARNYLQEGQLKDVSWIKCTKKKKRTAKKFVYKNVPDTIKGCYVGWGAPNDFVNPTARKSGLYAIQHCCGPHGAMGNFLAWHHIITKDKNGVAVNFSISRDSKWAEVNSYRPYRGQVDVTMHITGNLRIRVPDWVKRNKARLTIDGKKKKANFAKGNFVKAGKIKAGSTVSVRYPLRKTKITENLCGQKFTTEWRGDTVVAIRPRGKVHPFFNRTRLKTSKVPMGKVERYYPVKEMDW